jgi:hypothetical protein
MQSLRGEWLSALPTTTSLLPWNVLRWRRSHTRANAHHRASPLAPSVSRGTRRLWKSRVRSLIHRDVGNSGSVMIACAPRSAPPKPIDPKLLRSIRPKRARRPSDASVDPTEARKPVERRWPADACGSPPQAWPSCAEARDGTRALFKSNHRARTVVLQGRPLAWTIVRGG